MKKYFEHCFDRIPADLATVTHADVWTLEEYDFGDNETVKVNRFGFDPNQTGRYLPDEYWMMSDDLRYWDIAQAAMKKYDKLIERFPEKEPEEKLYKILKNKVASLCVTIQLLGKDEEGRWWGSNGKMKFVVVLPINTSRNIRDFETIKVHVYLQRLLEDPSGKKIAVVYCDAVD